MLKLTPISPMEAMRKAAQKAAQEALEGIPKPTSGKDGRDGRDGKDGVTTLVTKEVLANKEMLLEKEEFEKFKEYMVRTEQDIRNSLAQTHGYFAGGVTNIANVIEVSASTTIRHNQLDKAKINIILVKEPGITVTLPKAPAEIVILTQQGYTGTESYTICRED